MKQISLLAAATIVSLGSVVSANATVVTFSPFGGADPLYAVPPGETLYTDFSSSLPLGASGSGKIYTPAGTLSQAGDKPGTFVAAPDTPTGSTKGKFFAVTPGETETFTFGKLVADVGVYVGSVDPGNLFTLETTSGNFTWTGTQFGVVTGFPLPASGVPTETSKHSNGRFLFVDSTADILGIKVSETTSVKTNSFEIAQITTSATTIPEASTWAMLALGFGGLGVTAFRKSRKPVSELA